MQTLNIATLILDDDSDILLFIKEALEDNGIRDYHLFQNVDKFMDNIGDNMHILIIDHNLNSGLTGLEVMIKAIKKNPNVFVIAMSGTDDPKLVVAYLNYGCNRFVLKNDPEYLIKMIGFINEGADRFRRDIAFFTRQQEKLSQPVF